MRTIGELYWRRDRIEHIARFADANGLLVRTGPAKRNPKEMVYRYFGRTENGRHLLVVLLYLGQRVAMPVTARDMTHAERRRFREHLPEAR